MSLTFVLALVFGFFFAAFAIVQLICLAKRIHDSTVLNRQRQRQCGHIDRQSNVELGHQHSQYGDIFYIEPNSPEAVRIREQLEKDDKDLPSYEEVMRMCNLTTPTAAVGVPTTQPVTMETASIGIAALPALPAPPYSESDPYQSGEPTPTPLSALTVTPSEPSPSTSRAAQIPST